MCYQHLKFHMCKGNGFRFPDPTESEKQNHYECMWDKGYSVGFRLSAIMRAGRGVSVVLSILCLVLSLKS